ncbi:hypothetical protein RHMOL_Rhmol07G0316700 [Rhododendron molle]|uniref:Uncharacterized protein n=1 Tax=Rhododendron molle TaxID=49168 RepID=A0ACC0N740_RHOML|nr:hypothetical protein RHMOL_Rhmol07G0316700 [Rhododendron molle]
MYADPRRQSVVERQKHYEALGSWLFLRLGLIDAGAKFSGGLYSLSQKSAEDEETELLKSASGVNSRESSNSLKALEISVADISKQQKVMFTIQKEMQASLDRLVSPGPRSAPTLLSSTPTDTVDTSTTPADTTTPVADIPSSTTPSSVAPDVEDTPEPIDIF